MCLDNLEVRRLNQIRKKGHVLVKGYKVMNAVVLRQPCHQSSFRYRIGWNHALDYHNNIITRTKPYDKGDVIQCGLHFLTSLKLAKVYCTSNEAIIEVWYYADEVTACDVMDYTDGNRGDKKSYHCVVSRLRVKSFQPVYWKT